MNVQAVTLSGRAVRLEPLTIDHVEALWEVCEPDLLAYMDRPAAWTLPEFQIYLERVLSRPWVAFAVIALETGRVVGSTAYLDIRPADRGLEIGSTWIGKAWQGSRVNPEMKYLLLRHAFERLEAIRVQLKTDSRNLQSQAALAKLGAQREGTLRNHMIMPDGYFRHSVMFSITDGEWPGVKQALEARLGYVP